MTATVIAYLDAQPTDRILDIGCGDGKLTLEIAKTAHNGHVLGLDSSASMIETGIGLARASGTTNCSFAVEDCATISSTGASKILNGSWDKVFSNAAFHWILRRPESRVQALKAAFSALRPGGKFVFECGGFGNVAELQTALLASLVAFGVPLSRARELIPWFFASEDWMRNTLSGIGFHVDKIETEYRPTLLTPKAQYGGGLDGWVRLSIFYLE